MCEDYVVASSHIKHGPDWTPADATNFAAEQAASMVELAQQMLDAAAVGDLSFVLRKGPEIVHRWTIRTSPRILLVVHCCCWCT